MIDAYEIGIQLSLQDGVSAGLEVIARELAEVDRAVAASSAGLMALTRTAERAVRAVSAVAVTGARDPVPAMVPAAGQAGDVPAAAVPPRREPDVERGEPMRSPVVPRVRQEDGSGGAPADSAPVPGLRALRVQQQAAEDVRGGPRPAEGGAAPGPAVAAAPFPAGRLEPVRDDSVRPAPAPLITSSEPGGRSGRSGPTIQVAPSLVTAAPQVVEAAYRQPAPVTADRPTAVPIADAAVAPSQIRVEASRRERQEASHPIVVRAAVAEARAERATLQQAGQRIAGRETAVATRGGGASASADWVVHLPAVTIAPGMAGVPGQASVPPISRGPDRAAAPQPVAQDREQAGAGAVMLDGRLVGHWLTERMAREASRPPGGTSFFDPRQAPAWTPSGAL